MFHLGKYLQSTNNKLICSHEKHRETTQNKIKCHHIDTGKKKKRNLTSSPQPIPLFNNPGLHYKNLCLFMEFFLCYVVILHNTNLNKNHIIRGCLWMMFNKIGRRDMR